MADSGKEMNELGHGRTNGGAWLSALIFAALVLAIVAAFSPALDGKFLNWDDDRNFVENASFRGLGSAQWHWAWQTYHLGVWQPLAWLFFGAQWCGSGLQPRTYHGVSLAIHILNCAVLYLVVVRLLGFAGSGTLTHDRTWGRVFAAAATLLFAVHPLRVEAVAWVSAQPYLPAALFYLLAILSYLESFRYSRSPAAGRGWLLATYLCFAIAVMFKAVAVSLPFALLILDIYPLRRRGWRKLWEKFPLLLIALPVCLWAAAAKDASASRAPLHEFNLDARLAHAAHGLVFYLNKTALPKNLSPYYSLPKDLSLSTGRYALAAGIVVAVTVLTVLARRRWPAMLAAWAAYIVILLPNLGLIQIGQQLATDRYSYLAMMPITALFAGLFLACYRCDAMRKAGVPVVILFLTLLATGGLAWASRGQSRVWHDSKSLWSRALLIEPNCSVAHCNLGEALLREGRYTDASFYLSRAIDLDPDFAFAYSNFAVLLSNAQRFEDAVTAAQRALNSNPPLVGLDLARVHAVLGQAYAGLRKDDLAMEHTLKARELGFVEADKMIDYLRKFRGQAPAATRPESSIKN